MVVPGTHREDLTLELPAGSYRADWIDPASGAVVRTEKFDHPGGRRPATTPDYPVDIALRLRQEARCWTTRSWSRS